MLAATVMLGHFSAFYSYHLPFLLYGSAAVPAFYIISGFLITLVLHEKYHDKLVLFYSNRALRIFPLYWAALIVFLAVNWLVVGGRPPEPTPAYQNTSALWWAKEHGGGVGALQVALLAITNIFILGQDLILRIGRWPHLATPDYFYHFFIFVGPAWTIAVELWFYALAPFLVRGKAIWAVSVLSLSLAARAFAIGLGHTEFIVDYSFLPFELAFFMAGSLGYRAYVRLRASDSGMVPAYVVASCTAMALLTIFYLRLPLARPIYLLATCICLPGIVLAGGRNPLDNIFGELSYPIYLLHPIFTIFIVPGATIAAEIVAVCGTLALSLSLIHLVERPVVRYRRLRVMGADRRQRPISVPVRITSRKERSKARDPSRS